ncbi:MAG: hypothetical protein DHS20C14_08670 [Phycisphaeraceae bacterium]|nr:MAG: hypothetical protein DHS20C14_08670 [Phycisphaeraceae bacterium]
MTTTNRRYRFARGLTLVEVAISTVLIAGLMVSAMNAVGASVVAREQAVDSVRGQLLAETMLDAIVTLPYQDPGLGLGIGPIEIDLDDGLPTKWGQFDDVDDFNGWSSSPPEAADGSAIPGYTSDWQRAVSVRYLEPISLAQQGGLSANTGVKRITVTVKHHGRTVGTAVGVRTQGADTAREGAPAPDDDGGILGGILGGLFGG